MAKDLKISYMLRDLTTEKHTAFRIQIPVDTTMASSSAFEPRRMACQDNVLVPHSKIQGLALLPG